MSFSEFLNSRRSVAKDLVSHLQAHYDYVSVLGVDIQAKAIRVDRNTSNISAGRDTECGFVVKMSRGSVFFEYSLDDIQGDMAALAEEIAVAFRLNEELSANTIDPVRLSDEPLVQSFARPSDLDRYTETQLLDFCKDLRQQLQDKSEFILNALVMQSTLEVSKQFISPNRELDQNYAWVNGYLMAVYRENGKVVQTREGANASCIAEVLQNLPGKMDKLVEKAHKLTLAKPIEPGVYDAITDPTITGLIAHEAFGHGVEMAQFLGSSMPLLVSKSM